MDVHMASGMEEHRLDIGDDQQMAVTVSGRASGRTVLFLAAAPGSRLFDPDPAATVEAGVRLITVDRPGYGESSAWPQSETPAWGVVAERLGAVVEQFAGGPVSVVGWSNGGLAALALAARLPDRVERVALIGTPAPDDAVPWIPAEFREVLDAMRTMPEQAVGLLQEQMAPMTEDVEAALGGIAAGDADEAALAGPARERLLAMLREAFQQGAAGMATDIVATNVAPWGFDLSEVRQPVDLWYGQADVLVPPPHGAFYEGRLARAALHTPAGAGHLLPVTRWREVLGSLQADV